MAGPSPPARVSPSRSGSIGAGLAVCCSAVEIRTSPPVTTRSSGAVCSVTSTRIRVTPVTVRSTQVAASVPSR
jgi:hypothetical protein